MYSIMRDVPKEEIPTPAPSAGVEIDSPVGKRPQATFQTSTNYGDFGDMDLAGVQVHNPSLRQDSNYASFDLPDASGEPSRCAGGDDDIYGLAAEGGAENGPEQDEDQDEDNLFAIMEALKARRGNK